MHGMFEHGMFEHDILEHARTCHALRGYMDTGVHMLNSTDTIVPLHNTAPMVSSIKARVLELFGALMSREAGPFIAAPTMKSKCPAQ